jgi:hypothetical protein
MISENTNMTPKYFTSSKIIINLLKGIDNCSGAALKAIRQLWTPILLTIFLYFNFYKQCWPFMDYHSEISF